MRKEIVICGAGIAGIAAAYQLAVHSGIRDVLLVDPRPPLTMTSDKSSECYRNWWPGPDAAMVRLMNRSIDMLEELADRSGNIFHMNRRGYAFATGRQAQLERYRIAGEQAAEYGAGSLRVHATASGNGYMPAPANGYRDMPTGADLLLEPDLVRQHFPYLSEETLGVLHIRRAGWLSAQQLGIYMLEQAQAAGVELQRAEVVGVECQAGKVHSVQLNGGGRVRTEVFVNAAGPLAHQVARMLEIELPLISELHLKAAFHDTRGIVPRDIPMVIWGDEVYLEWRPEERELLAGSEEMAWLLEELPSGAHTRPDGGVGSDVLLMLWEYNSPIIEPVFPIQLDDLYPEIVLRGLARMIPGLKVYLERLPKPALDGGYYTKTSENRPLAGRMPVPGSFILGAISGFGIMSAPALGELVAAHITQDQLPDYAPAFELSRYEDQAYKQQLRDWGENWQL